jgi:hypothetical protein
MRKPIVILILLCSASSCFARIITVDEDGPADFNNIQAAINSAINLDSIIVAPGTYTGPGNRDIDFLGKAITVSSVDPNDPKVIDTTIINCDAIRTNPHRAFHFHTNEGPSSLLAGLTIINGYEDYGGGIQCDSSDPTIVNCKLVGNTARIDGGGLYNSHSTPILTNCTFTSNRTGPGLPGHSFGGGIHNYYSSPRVVMCKFEGNYSAGWGGGMANNVYSSPIVVNCAFIRNSGAGSGMFNTNYSSPQVINCIFIGNGTGGGAGMYNAVHSNPTLINCTFSGNRSDVDGGGIFNSQGSSPTLTNCILWANRDNRGTRQSSQIQGETPIINYCCIQGWTGSLGGVGNTGEDPLFVDIDGSDNLIGTADDNVHLVPESPCVDAGNNAIIPADTMDLDHDANLTELIPWDFDAKPRIRRSIVDMGAFEAPLILFVDIQAKGGNHGTSWADAFNYLQDALTAVLAGDEIRVAHGLYKPDQGAGITLGDRYATFQLKNGVNIRGGYAGYDKPDPNERDIKAYETILTGDLNDDDKPNFVNNNENSLHVVNGSGTDATAVLDGFTITAGNAQNTRGGGMYNDSGNPTITNCTFNRNSALNGGGMSNEYSSPTLVNCTFSDNTSSGAGAGMCNYHSCSPMLTHCTFSRNSAAAEGGGIFSYEYNYDSSLILIQCFFKSNLADWGGGMFNIRRTMILTNCAFTGNSADSFGGGVLNSYGDLTLTNCTFNANSADSGGAMFSQGDPNLKNCILWGDTPEEIFVNIGTALVTYSDVQGGWPGKGNIDADPCFVDLGYWNPNSTPEDANDDFWVDGDYHLKSQAGRWNPTNQRWVKDTVTSPCIDVGHPASDWTAELWPHGKVINMGVHGGTSEASMSLLNVGNIADLNNDGTVNYTDLMLLTEAWLKKEPLILEDLNRNSSVDFLDFALFTTQWLKGLNP